MQISYSRTPYLTIMIFHVNDLCILFAHVYKVSLNVIQINVSIFFVIKHFFLPHY